MDYQLENLGDERFQEVCQALLARAYPETQCFPVGQRDAGRDAVVFLSRNAPDEFAVYQVKYVRKPLAEKDPHKWLIGILQEEMPKVKKLVPKGARAFYLLTNIPGTAFPDSGSIDAAARLINATLDLPSHCWWRDDINRRLDDAWDVKWAYPEILSGPDVLRFVVEHGLGEHAERRTNALRAFVGSQFEMDQEVRFKQVELQNQLLDLFIDVPALFRERPSRRSIPDREYRAFHIVAHQNRVADEFPFPREGASVGAATLLLHPLIQHYVPHIVLEGAPGQGKSTIVQYICQIHRQRMLGVTMEDPRIPEKHRTVPIRLPFKVDLRDFALWLKKKDPFSTDDANDTPHNWHKSLEGFLAALVRHGAGGAEFSIADLLAVARLSALLLVFDGLDEVAEIETRRDVVDEITKGVTRLRENAASLQTVVTSRPAAFANSPGLPERTFRYFELSSITRPLIDAYTAKWIKARRLQGREASDVRRILRDKLGQPHLRELARNPMQLAILLSLIHTRGSSLPDKRTALYDSYVELFFNREAEKSDVVRAHRDLLIDIHRYLAWILHAEAQTAAASGSIRVERLKELVATYLRDEGRDPTLGTMLFTGMVERVVALVSRVEGTYEFEVQPLREYFAARHLYNTANYSPPGNPQRGTLPDRFHAMARDFYWLNVARFYAGCYNKGELPSLVDGLEELAREDGYRHTSHPRMLAATLLADWVFAQHPKSMRKVVAMIVDGVGLRNVLSGVSGGHRRPEMMVLPPGNGKEELLDRCFTMLELSQPQDFANSLVDLINANATHLEKSEAWATRFRAIDRRKRTEWIRYGLHLGILRDMSEEQLEEATADMPIDLRRMALIIRAGKAAFYERTEQLFRTAVESVLDSYVVLPSGKPPQSLVEGLGQALDTFRYAYSFSSREPRPLKDVVARMMGPWFDDDQGAVSPGPAYPMAHKAREFLDTARECSNRTAREWATELRPWETLVEKGRTLFGDRWAIHRVAAVAAGIRAKDETGAGYASLLDHAAPLCRRARWARLKAGNATWWREQLAAASADCDVMFVLLMALTWGGPTVLAKLAGEIDGMIAGLPREDWSRLYRGIEHARLGSGRSHELIDLKALSLPPSLDARTVGALGLRVTSEVADALYDRFLTDYQGCDVAVLGFCQNAVIRRAESDPSTWQNGLALVARSYAKGAVGDRYFGYHFARNALSLPLDVAREIVEHADTYPRELVYVAEYTCRMDVATRIDPVGEVAEQDGWFHS
jgi:hypothetical protein